MKRKRLSLLTLVLTLCCGAAHPGPLIFRPQDQEGARKAREVIDKAIQALGGPAYLQVKGIQSQGRYFIFKGEQQAGAKFLDYTRLPQKSRFQLGEGKNQEVTIFDLDKGEGWILEGKKDLKPATEKELEDFKRTVKHAIENVLRSRWKEEGVSLFYYGADHVEGKSNSEAVELIDSTNDSILLFFDVQTHLPVKMEFTEIGREGRKVKMEEMYFNWHDVQGVKTPFQIERYAEDRLVSQTFVEKITYGDLPDSLFTKPAVEKKK